MLSQLEHGTFLADGEYIRLYKLTLQYMPGDAAPALRFIASGSQPILPMSSDALANDCGICCELVDQHARPQVTQKYAGSIN